MRAAVFRGQLDVTATEVPEPELSSGDVLLQVTAASARASAARRGRAGCPATRSSGACSPSRSPAWCGVCSEPSAVRREAARRAGATHVVDPAAESLAERVASISDDAGIAVAGRVLFFGGLPKSRPTTGSAWPTSHRPSAVHGTPLHPRCW